VPLWWIREAAKAMKGLEAPAMLVAIELLYAVFRTGSATFPLPNAGLAKIGVSKDVKRRALQRLEKAGLITVERKNGKTPEVTLTVL
jgi:hypothetical protein